MTAKTRGTVVGDAPGAASRLGNKGVTVTAQTVDGHLELDLRPDGTFIVWLREVTGLEPSSRAVRLMEGTLGMLGAQLAHVDGRAFVPYRQE